MEYLINLALGIVGSLIAAEIVFHHKRWCRRIIQSAVEQIKDSTQSEIKREEWLAALDEHVGVIASFSHAIGCWFGAPAVAAALNLPVPNKTRGRRLRIKFRSTTNAEEIKWMQELVETYEKIIDASQRALDSAKTATKWLKMSAALSGVVWAVLGALAKLFW
jgi:hypothetical protein